MLDARIVTSPADRLRVLRVAHAATSPEKPFETWAGIRLRVPRRREADWWLLEEDGEAVSSLICYPLRFRAGARRLGGFGLGAVATHPDHRKRGHASRLCRLAAEASAALADLYERQHDRLHLERDEAEMRRSLDRNAEDMFLELGDPLRGYVRLYLEETDEVEIVECVVPPEERAGVLRAVGGLAAAMGRASVKTWLPPGEGIDGHFEDRGRPRTQPMVRGDVIPDGAQIYSADYF